MTLTQIKQKIIENVGSDIYDRWISVDTIKHFINEAIKEVSLYKSESIEEELPTSDGTFLLPEKCLRLEWVAWKNGGSIMQRLLLLDTYNSGNTTVSEGLPVYYYPIGNGKYALTPKPQIEGIVVIRYVPVEAVLDNDDDVCESSSVCDAAIAYATSRCLAMIPERIKEAQTWFALYESAKNRALMIDMGRNVKRRFIECVDYW